jgi:hypothetical protein
MRRNVHPKQYEQQRLLSTREAAQRYGLGESTLEKDRVFGQIGFPYLKIGRRVLYDPEQVEKFLQTCRRTSTSDPGPVVTSASRLEAALAAEGTVDTGDSEA